MLPPGFRTYDRTGREPHSGMRAPPPCQPRLPAAAPRVPTGRTGHSMQPEYRRYGEAESLFRQALAIQEKALGPEHPDIAPVLFNYAMLLRRIGRKSQARELDSRARRIRTAYSGTPAAQTVDYRELFQQK